MPRDASGNYTLPVGNPVVDGTIIETGWANPTMNDIALQLNNVLTRDGLLGPTTPIKFVDGTSALPAVSFNSDPNTGMYLIAPDTIGFSVGGVTVFSLDASQAVFAVPPKYNALPATPDTLANKAYVDAAVAGGGAGVYLPLAGGALSGALGVGIVPSSGALIEVDGGVHIQSTHKLSFTGTINQTYIHASASNTLTFGTNNLARLSIGSTGTSNFVAPTSGNTISADNTSGGTTFAALNTNSNGRIAFNGAGLEMSFGNYLVSGATEVLTVGSPLAIGTRGANGITIIANSSGVGSIDTSGNLGMTGDITAFSDDTVKENWKEIDQFFVEDLAKVKAGVYDRTDIPLRQVGVSAQSLRQVIPEAVREAQNGKLSVNYGHAALVACVALAREIVRLKDFAHDHSNRAN